MDSVVKIVKATGIVHIIHGAIIGILLLIMTILSIGSIPVIGNMVLLALTAAVSFLYIYIGYELTAFRPAQKTRNLLIASIMIAGIEVLTAIMKSGGTNTAGIFFIAELILSTISLANIKTYEEIKEKNNKKK